MSITLTEVAAKEIKSIVEQQNELARKNGEEPKPLYLRAPDAQPQDASQLPRR